MTAADLPPPAALQVCAVPYWNAFAALQDDRDAIVVLELVQPIPTAPPIMTSRIVERPLRFEAIDRYATRYRIADAAFDRLRRLLNAMDDEYRAILAEHRAGVTQNDESEGDHGD